ncbi:hypothetical protein VNO77_18781 [Canavalia gladiata]|uniref:NAC domain-containing protein n=1 Tax=Canavalia gladiata TaxID=3824 RepID=A0AAN9QJY5_CANGL
MEETVLVGYRFRPTDEELVDHYLKYKLLGHDYMVHNIAEVDVCKYEPWDLPAFSKVKSDDPEWFFFSPRQLKYLNSNRSNRATESGFWKPTGRDRNICRRGTHDCIGTKKTLVFHKRVPHVAKTNWVIHEYHAATFPVEKRTFVLCRLMEKPEKKTQVRTDELIDEGEPVPADTITYEHIWSEMAPLFLPPQTDESDFPSLQYSPIVTDPELFHDSRSANFGNENYMLQFRADTTEDEYNDEEFWKSILVDEEDVVIREERRNAYVRDTTPPQLSTRVYYESSETDKEVVSAQHDNIFGNTSACRHAVSSGYQVMRMVDTSQDAAYARPLLSSKTEVKREKNDGSVGDNFGSMNTAGDIESISSSTPTASCSSTSTRCKVRSRRASPRRPQTQRKVSSKALSQHLPKVKKETSILESNKDQTKGQDVMSRNHSSSLNRKGCFIDMQTPSVVSTLNVIHGMLSNEGSFDHLLALHVPIVSSFKDLGQAILIMKGQLSRSVKIHLRLQELNNEPAFSNTDNVSAE